MHGGSCKRLHMGNMSFHSGDVHTCCVALAHEKTVKKRDNKSLVMACYDL